MKFRGLACQSSARDHTQTQCLMDICIERGFPLYIHTSNFIPVEGSRWKTVETIKIEIKLFWIRISLENKQGIEKLKKQFLQKIIIFTFTSVTPNITPFGFLTNASIDITSASAK